MGAFISQCFPPKPEFSVDQIPDLGSKVAIVTGGNSGIGKETIKALLNRNCKVYMATRSQTKAEEAIAELKIATGKEPIFLHLDLGDLASIKKAAEEFKSNETQLHILFNNAAVMEPPLDQVTTQGYDLQFGTNALGPYFFTKLLLPVLVETAKVSPDGKARIITTSSLSHTLAPKDGVDWPTLSGDEKAVKLKKKLGGQAIYGQSKWANIVMSNEFARRYADQGILAISLNPGNLKTPLQRYIGGGLYGAFLNTVLLYPAPLGALTQLWAGATEEALKYNGQYLWPWARPGPARPDTNDQAKATELIGWFDKQLEGYE